MTQILPCNRFTLHYDDESWEVVEYPCPSKVERVSGNDNATVGTANPGAKIDS